MRLAKGGHRAARPSRPAVRHENVVRHDKTVKAAAIGAGVGTAGRYWSGSAPPRRS
jgi:hypothetical protein